MHVGVHGEGWVQTWTVDPMIGRLVCVSADTTGGTLVGGLLMSVRVIVDFVCKVYASADTD